MKTQQEYIEQGEQYILKTYNRFPVVLEKGEGVYLYDADQKKYLDFGAGIAVFALGYGNLSLIHISEPTRRVLISRMPSCA